MKITIFNTIIAVGVVRSTKNISIFNLICVHEILKVLSSRKLIIVMRSERILTFRTKEYIVKMKTALFYRKIFCGSLIFYYLQVILGNNKNALRVLAGFVCRLLKLQHDNILYKISRYISLGIYQSFFFPIFI